MLGKTPSEGNPKIQKAGETRGEPLVIEENSNNGENKEPEKEVSLLDQSEKDNPSLIHSDLGAEVVKEGGNQKNQRRNLILMKRKKRKGKSRWLLQARRRQEEANQPNK